MMQWLSVNEVQARLPELVKLIASGDEVVITDHDRPVARLVRQEPVSPKARRPGSAKGKLRVIVEDDEHLDDFRDGHAVRALPEKVSLP
jgi:antitoxin (DNA-binding transcriptional repressor) of toxin-antitoxin stability system